MTKQELRKIYLERRKALSEGEYAQLNFQLYQNFFSNIDLSFIRVIHTFIPITSKREPDTWLIIDRIRREYPHVRISIPRVNAETNELENLFFEGLHQLNTNDWGIQEPKQGVPTDPEKIDMVLVPLLVCDNNGHRVGYGKGYYDRFLKDCRPDVKKIGVSLFEPVDVIEDIQSTDIPVNVLLTPIEFRTF
jgi:5-formyltetrahydrofolate cyclo-ligase